MKTKDSCKVWTVLLALVAVTYAAYGAPTRSKGVPSGWFEDFNAAKAAAAKENKHILMCSIASDTYWGKKMYNEVYSQGKFSGKLKKQFILMMVDMARDSKNLSHVALEQNMDLRSRYNVWGSGNCCVVDKDGNSLKHFSIEGDAFACWIRVETATKDIPPPVKQAADGVRPGNAPNVVQRPSVNRPTSTGHVVTSTRSMTSSAHLREGNRLAVIGEWNEALEHFRHSGGRLAKIAEFEAEGKAPTVKLADAWWLAMSHAPDAKTRLAYQSHAAHLYRMALAEGGLSKDVAETAAQRGVEKGTSLYCVIDLSGGVNAASYPVSYLDDVPEGGWSDEYKTRKLVLRRIEPGTFIMGEDQNDKSHSATITKPFYIGVFETTQKQWEFVTGTEGSKKHVWCKGDMRPANEISYSMICGATKTEEPASFIGRIRARSGLNLGLPTEAQWEYACRAGTTSAFNNGGNGEDDMAKLGRYYNNQSAWRNYHRKESMIAFAKAQQHPDGKGVYPGGLAAVGAYLPNKWGLYDMHGNVTEICRDWNWARFFGADPVGSTTDDIVTKRGGDWNCGVRFNEHDKNYLNGLKSHSSSRIKRDEAHWFTGFRVCASIGTMRLAASADRPATQPVSPSTPSQVVSTTSAPTPVVSAPTASLGVKKLYCVIDLSGGSNATSYPVSQLDAVPNGGWSDEYKTTKLVLRRIDPGTFIKGRKQNDESRRVTITWPFYMGVFEVTQKQYELVTGNNPSEFQGAMRPVGNLSFNDIRGDAKVHNWPNVHTVDANSFVGRIRARTGLNIDLPPETEWEYACRAGTTSKFNNGGNGEDDWVKVGRVPPNQSELGYLEPKKFQYDHKPDGKGGYDSYCTVVGMYLPNAWGLYDMHGNLWEWTLEWAPLGSRDGTDKVTMGGCWNSPLSECTSSSYRKHAPHDKWRQAGFRLFISATGGSEGHLSQQKRRADSVPVASSQPEVPTVQPRSRVSSDKLYCVIDLSVGASASSYPVSYLKEVPGNEWPDEYKTKKLVLRCVEPGTFIVGSTGRRATISKPYYIGVFEVTQSQWELVMGENPSSMKGAMRPVEGVSFATARGGDADADAASFVGRLRARTKLDVDLPVPERWEYACRAGTTSKFNNGCDSESEEMWQLGRFYLNQALTLPIESAGAGANGTHQRPDGRGGFRTGHTAVGSYLPNNWRLYDMHGNVAEMCLGAEGICVLRGGSWTDSESRSGTCFLTSSAWKTKPRNVRENWIGLRLVIGIAE